MPSQANTKGLFDRFATRVDTYTSRAWFFALCVLLVLLWAPTIVFFPLDTWQLIINTLTTIITFLLVALLQNTAKRGDDANQQKLNAIAAYLVSDGYDRAKQELREAIGLEDREGSA